MRDRLLNNDNFIFWFILIDIFFLPYFNLVVIPISYFLIIWWAINNRTTIMMEWNYNRITVCILFMCVSTAFGCLMYSEYGVIGDNIKRLIQYIITFQYIFFFQYYFRKYRPNLKHIIWIFIAFVVFMAALFQINPSLYSAIVSIWNRGNAYISTSFQESINFGYALRYGFIWTDQNNIAYALTAIIMFLLCCFDTDWGEIIILFCANVFVLVNSMSSGGWISFIISWSAFIIYRIFFTEKTPQHLRYVKTGSFIKIVIVLIVIVFAFEAGVFSSFADSSFVQLAIERFENNENTRDEIWMQILSGESIVWHILIGKGATLIIQGVERAAHSGHLYWIYGFGFISYFILMQQMFWLGLRKIWRYIPMIGFFLCFTMNTMVGEQKLFLIAIMIISYLREEYSDEQYD